MNRIDDIHVKTDSKNEFQFSIFENHKGKFLKWYIDELVWIRIPQLRYLDNGSNNTYFFYAEIPKENKYDTHVLYTFRFYQKNGEKFLNWLNEYDYEYLITDDDYIDTEIIFDFHKERCFNCKDTFKNEDLKVITYKRRNNFDIQFCSEECYNNSSIEFD